MAHVEVTLQATVREIGTGNATFSERGFHPDRIADDRANETNDGLDVVAHDMAEELFRYARAVSFRSEEAFELARIDDVLAILVIMPAEFVFARLRGLSLGRRNGRAQSIQETALDGLVEGFLHGGRWQSCFVSNLFVGGSKALSKRIAVVLRVP